MSLIPLNDRTRRILAEWFISDDTGVSSETMFAVLLGQDPEDVQHHHRYGRGVHPVDPGDLGRCIRLLDLLPTKKMRKRLLDRMIRVSEEWAVVVKHWAELRRLHDVEVTTRCAPRCYARMKELGL